MIVGVCECGHSSMAHTTDVCRGFIEGKPCPCDDYEEVILVDIPGKMEAETRP